MKRMFSMFYAPDMSGTTGGGSQSAAQEGAPQTATTVTEGESGRGSQSPSPGSQSQGAGQPESVESLNQRLLNGEQLTHADLDRVLAAVQSDEGSAPAANQDPELTDDDLDDNGLKKDVKPGEIPEAEAKTLKDAMRLVGARDVNQLPEKINELLTQVRTSGGNLGRENKRLNDTLDGQNTLIADLLDGKPEAINVARKIAGRGGNPDLKPGVESNSKNASANADAGTGTFDQFLMSDDDIASSVDPDFAKQMNGRMKGVVQMFEKSLKDLKQGIEPLQQELQATTQKASRERANQQVMGDLSELASRFGDVYGVQTGNIGAMLAEFSQTGVVDPRIQPLIETAQYMVDHGLPSIEIAHKVRFFDKVSDHTDAVLNAKKETRAKILNRNAPVSAAGSATGGTKSYSDAELQKMAGGKIRVPDEWLSPNGQFDLAKIPADVKERLGL